jgi:hypothetical protein
MYSQRNSGTAKRSVIPANNKIAVRMMAIVIGHSGGSYRRETVERNSMFRVRHFPSTLWRA